MRSFRAHLLLSTSILAVAALGGSLLLAFLLMREAMHREFDATLVAQARAAAAMAVRDGRRLRVEYDAVDQPEYARDERPDVFCFRDRHGTVLLRSPGLGTHDLPAVLGTVGRPDVRDVRLPDGRPARLAGFSFAARLIDEDLDVPGDGRALSVVVARDTTDRDRQLLTLAGILAAVAVTGAALTVLGMWWMARRLVRPLDVLGQRIGAITADRLSDRLGDLALPSELAPVRVRVDDLLARLETAFQRERAFTADAAHELRTPLAGLRTTLEVALAQDRPAGDYRRALQDGFDIGLQMQALVDNLLMLARVEAGQVRVEREATDPAILVDECWASVAARAEVRGLQLRREIEVGVVPLDRAKLRLVLGNLLANAVTYADDGGDLRIRMRSASAALALEIDNSGCTLPPAAAGHVFERFWRGDAAHSAAGLHCGLGLALCRQLVQVQGGTIGATISDGRFRVAVMLPLSG